MIRVNFTVVTGTTHCRESSCATRGGPTGLARAPSLGSGGVRNILDIVPRKIYEKATATVTFCVQPIKRLSLHSRKKGDCELSGISTNELYEMAILYHTVAGRWGCSVNKPDPGRMEISSFLFLVQYRFCIVETRDDPEIKSHDHEL